MRNRSYTKSESGTAARERKLVSLPTLRVPLNLELAMLEPREGMEVQEIEEPLADTDRCHWLVRRYAGCAAFD